MGRDDVSGTTEDDDKAEPQAKRLVALADDIASPAARALFRVLGGPVEKLLSLAALNRMYAELSPQPSDRTYFGTALRGLGVEYDLAPEDLGKIPPVGPLLVVANHPFGGIDGLILGDILTRVREDFRLLANRLLYDVRELRPWIIPVDAFGGPQAHGRNLSHLRLALRRLEQGGALGIFPAGTVSHLQLRQGGVVDPPWHTTAARLARRTGATVLTLFFDGRNSLVFQLSGLVHPRLRTALLPSEMLKRGGSRVAVRIGRPIAPYKVARYPDDGVLTSYLRFKTYMLKWRESPVRPRFAPPPAKTPAQPIAAPWPTASYASELERLPASGLLCEEGAYSVFVAEAAWIPRLLDEIGRLRERAFRAAGEGTGRAYDLDRFDSHYQHLVLWSRAERAVLGSYRLGRVDRILSTHGADGLYSSTLFKLKPGLLDRIGRALELGRSFVRLENQGQAGPLALLWRGIGAFLVRHPTYKILFGPVSISREYAALSRRLMVELLGKHYGHEGLGALVRARNPLRGRLPRDARAALAALVRNADDIAALVSDIEEDNKPPPALLRHYLRLNAFLLSFNLDPSFGNCIDGLIVVDLRTSEPKLLRRYLGAEGYQIYTRVPGTTPVLVVERPS
jgi:putative hemolysin